MKNNINKISETIRKKILIIYDDMCLKYTDDPEELTDDVCDMLLEKSVFAFFAWELSELPASKIHMLKKEGYLLF